MVFLRAGGWIDGAPLVMIGDWRMQGYVVTKSPCNDCKRGVETLKEKLDLVREMQCGLIDFWGLAQSVGVRNGEIPWSTSDCVLQSWRGGTNRQVTVLCLLLVKL